MQYGFTIPGSGRLTENMSAIAKRREPLGYHVLAVHVFERKSRGGIPVT